MCNGVLKGLKKRSALFTALTSHTKSSHADGYRPCGGGLVELVPSGVLSKSLIRVRYVAVLGQEWKEGLP